MTWSDWCECNPWKKNHDFFWGNLANSIWLFRTRVSDQAIFQLKFRILETEIHFKIRRDISYIRKERGINLVNINEVLGSWPWKGKMILTRSLREHLTSSEKNNLIFGSEMPRRARIINKMYNFSCGKEKTREYYEFWLWGTVTPLKT